MHSEDFHKKMLEKIPKCKILSGVMKLTVLTLEKEIHNKNGN